MALWLLLPGVVLAFLALVLFSYTFARVPLPAEISAGATVLLDQAGREIGELTPHTSRQDVSLAELPPHVRHAVLAAEDAGFYDHPGVSVPGIVRAAFRNLVSREVTQGGSTISQQYIKNVTDQREQSALRKIREAALAMKLERQFSKDQILEFYLNTIYFGRGAYGIQAAAQAYFGKDAADLDVREGAALAAILNRPNGMDPAEGKEAKAELGRFATQNRVSIPLAQMPQHVRDAVIAAEDRSFWENRGIDPKGILRAAFSNATSDSTQGASTITQQYVKILYLTQERTLTRKVKEAFLSLKVHNQQSTEEILQGYLNTIYFGRGAYGIQAA
ncbi:MAG: transglycosylase domain-containing protein, partial [Actinomycetes bacterium]